jgi:hypothetical protein
LGLRGQGDNAIEIRFVSPEIVDIFAVRSNLQIIKKSEIDPINLYLNRDYLSVLEKTVSGAPRVVCEGLTRGTD